MTALAPEAAVGLRVGVVTGPLPDVHERALLDQLRDSATFRLCGSAPWSDQVAEEVSRWGPLDVLVWLASSEPPTHLGARHGLWRFDYGGEPAETAGLEDWVRGYPIRLRMLAVDGGNTRLLRESWIPPEPYRYSAQRETLRVTAVRWVERVLRELAGGALHTLPAPPVAQRHPTRFAPVTAARVTARLGRRLAESFTHRPSWRIGVIDRPIATFAAGRALDDGEIRWLEHTVPHGYLADPIGAMRDGRAYLFAEVLQFDTERGRLVVLEGDGATFSPPEPLILDGPLPDVHMSFPCVFEAEGAWWCVPERQAAREVALYRATGFPRRWRREATLLEGVAACDPILFHREDLWWLLATDASVPGGALLAWYAERLTGPYRPHRLNPLVEGLGAARQAGPMFHADGRLYRPAQDGRGGYGSAITIYEVLQLDPGTWREQRAGRVTPDPWGACPVGVHTLSPLGASATLIDGKRWVLDRAHLRKQARYKLLRR